MPSWLRTYTPGTRVNITDILKGRTVFYPGSRFDGEPVRVFNRAGYAHLFVYADYGLPEEELRRELTDRAFRGYRILDIRNYTERELCPNGWTQHYRPTAEEMEWIRDWVRGSRARPYCLLTVLERKSGFGEAHGAQRFAILFLMADGIATYDALFANRHRAPDVLVLQDHGFGGNYNRFCQGGAMERIALDGRVLPGMLHTCQYDTVWTGYTAVPGVPPDSERCRRLFRRADGRPS